MRYKTVHASALYCNVIKVHHIGSKYVSCKLQFFYKINNEECLLLRKKNYKIIRSVYDSWENYEPK